MAPRTSIPPGSRAWKRCSSPPGPVPRNRSCRRASPTCMIASARRSKIAASVKRTCIFRCRGSSEDLKGKAWGCLYFHDRIQNMDAIRFNTVVGDDHLIHVPAEVNVPAGELQVTLAPIKNSEDPATALAKTREWILALVEEAEKANPN